MATTLQLLSGVVIVTAFLLADPFKMSLIAEVDFTPSKYSDLIPANPDPPSDVQDLLTSAEIKFKRQIFGPESLAFDARGEGPYTGLGDGRVVKWTGETGGWVTFATTSPNRLPNCTLEVPGPNLLLEHICGRPLGLRFHPATGDLYIADAYYGLMVVGQEGGQARLLTSEAEGGPLGFTNDMDIDDDGTVYFTDSSTKYRRRQFLLEILEGGAYGRLLKYEPKTGATSVLLSGLRFPNGVALSADRSFLLFCETTLLRIQRYWLKGPKAGTAEVFMDLPGWPDNIRRNPRGRFWVALHARRNSLFDWMAVRPWARTTLLKLPIGLKFIYAVFIRLPHGIVMELDEYGKMTQILEDKEGAVVKAVSEVEEREGELWMGSVFMSHVAVYKLENSELEGFGQATSQHVE